MDYLKQQKIFFLHFGIMKMLWSVKNYHLYIMKSYFDLILDI